MESTTATQKVVTKVTELTYRLTLADLPKARAEAAVRLEAAIAAGDRGAIAVMACTIGAIDRRLELLQV